MLEEPLHCEQEQERVDDDGEDVSTSRFQEDRCAGGRVKCSRTHIDLPLAASAKQVQQSTSDGRLSCSWTRGGNGGGIALSRRRGIVRIRCRH